MDFRLTLPLSLHSQRGWLATARLPPQHLPNGQAPDQPPGPVATESIRLETKSSPASRWKGCIRSEATKIRRLYVQACCALCRCLSSRLRTGPLLNVFLHSTPKTTLVNTSFHSFFTMLRSEIQQARELDNLVEAESSCLVSYQTLAAESFKDSPLHTSHKLGNKQIQGCCFSYKPLLGRNASSLQQNASYVMPKVQ